MTSDDQASAAPAIDRLAGTLEQMLDHYRRERAGDGVWKWSKRFLFAAIALSSVVMTAAFYGIGLFGMQPAPTRPSVVTIPLRGTIAPGEALSADIVVPLITQACKTEKVRGLVLQINSPGGSPTEAGRIADALDRCPRDKPIVAVVEGLGASAAYLIAVHASRIVADRYSLVGSIGALMSGYDATGVLAKVGVVDRTYASGPLKTMGSPTRAATPVQEKVAQSLVDGIASTFAEEVKRRRGERLAESPDLFSGRVWVADDALRLGLIDRIGEFESVLDSDFHGLEVLTYRPRESAWNAMSFRSMTEGIIDGIFTRLNDLHVE